MQVTLNSQSEGIAHVAILPEQGGRLCSIDILQSSGAIIPLLYSGSHQAELGPGFPFGMPFCFPFCGRVMLGDRCDHYSLDGKNHLMPIHGFAWRSQWQVLMANDTQCKIALVSSPLSYQYYPFDFELTLHYQLTDGCLLCLQTVVNSSDRAMPYYSGYHPYFLRDPSNPVTLSFEADQRLGYDKSFTKAIHQHPLLTMPIASDDPSLHEQLHFFEESNQVQLHYANGLALQMQVLTGRDSNASRYLQSYLPADAPFFCLEHWMAPAGAIMHARDKMRLLPKGEVDRSVWMFGQLDLLSTKTQAMLSSWLYS